MSDPFNPNRIPSTQGDGSTTVIDPADVDRPVIPPVTGGPVVDVRDERAQDHERRNPLENITPEKPRNHPIAYVALATAALALILSLLSMGDDSSDYRQVKIGNNDCVLGPAGDTDALYCRTPAVP